MQDFIEYFFHSSDQAIAITSVTVIWLAMTSLGAWISGKERLVAADIVSGWALVSLILTLGGIFTPLSFTVLVGISASVVVLSLIFVARREGFWLPISFFKLIFLAIPLLLIASAMQGSQWDEFSDWLAIPRYLFVTDHLPGAENPYPAANVVAYPFNWHYINYLVSSLAGKFLENVGPIFNVLLLFAFSLALLNVINRLFGDDKLLNKQNWSLIAFVGLATTLFNPTFAQKIVLTSYADTSTAVVTGFSVVLAWFTLECLSEGNRSGARNCALQLSMSFVVLINLKQATFAIFGLVVLGFLLTAYRDRSIPFSTSARMILVVCLPALIVFVSWRHYVTQELPFGEAVFLPLSQWHIEHISAIILQMLITLLKKGYYFGLVIIICALSVRALWNCERPVDRLFLLSGFLIVGYNAFLFLAYVSSFGEADALRVASYWRYNMHMGAVTILAAGVGAVICWQRYIPWVRPWRHLTWVPVILLVAAPIVYAKKLRFDLNPMIQHYRMVGGELQNFITPNSRYFVLDPQGSGESYNITTYELNDLGKPMGYLAAFHKIDQNTITRTFADERLTHVIIYSVTSVIKDVLSLKLRDDTSQLLKRSKGVWTIVASWTLPKNSTSK